MPSRRKCSERCHVRQKLGKNALLAVLVAALFGCAGKASVSNSDAGNADRPVERQASSTTVDESSAEAGIHGETVDDPAGSALAQAMQGEMALREGRREDAATLYRKAAEVGSDPSIAERATRLAIYAKAWPDGLLSAQRWQQLAPDSLLAQQAVISIAIRLGNEKLAGTEIQSLLTSTSEPSARLWQLLGQSLVGHDDKKLPVKLFRKALARHPNSKDMDTIFAQSQIAQVLSEPELAQQIADQAVRNDRKATRPLLWRAQLSLEQGQVDAALEDYQRAIDLDPDDRELRLGYAALAAESGRPERAQAQLALLPQDDPDVLVARAAYAQEAGDEQNALLYYRALAELKPDDRNAHHYRLGQLAESLKLDQEALEWYGQVRAGEQRQQARLRRAVVMGRLQQHDAALLELRDLQRSEDDEMAELAFLVEGELFAERSEREAEVLALDRGLARFANAPRLLYARALSLIHLRRVEQAERDLRRLLALDPDAGYALNALGYTLADETDRHEEALEYIEKALAQSPDEPAVIDSMGWVLYRLGRHEEALSYLQRAHELQPEAEIAAHLGEVLWALDRRDEARKIWAEAAAEAPDDRRLMETRARLEGAKSSGTP